MKKNLFRKYSGCFFYGLLFLLTVSCRNEALFTEDAKVKTEIIAKQMKFDELQTIPNLANKIASYKNDVNRVYADSIHHFTVDTDYGLYLEDANHNKTYTFKIERTPPSPIFENLVLKDLGNGVFDAYIAKYDSILLGNHENIPTNQVKNYFGLAYIGTKNTTDVFGKLSTCSFTITSEIFVPGTCSSDQHHEAGDPNANCQCGTPGHLDCTPASEGYYTTVYTTYYLSCDDGGSVSGTTGTYTPTSPYPSGGGGTTAAASPCNKIKNANTTYPALKPALGNLAGTTSQSNENGFFIDNTATSSTANPIQNLIPSVGGAVQINTPSGNIKYKIIAHTHDANGPFGTGTFSIFSWLDLTRIAELIKTDHIDDNIILFLSTADGTHYALTIEDPQMLAEYFDVKTDPDDPYNTNPNFVNGVKMIILDKTGDKYYDNKPIPNRITLTSNPLDDKKIFLQMVKDLKFNITLFETDPTFTTFSKLSLSAGNIIPTPCN